MKTNILENGTFKEVQNYFDYEAETDIVTPEELEMLEFNSDLIVIDNGLSYYGHSWYSIYRNDIENDKDYTYYISLELDDLMKEEQFDIYCYY